MANILERLHHEIPEFPIGGDSIEQLEFLYETLEELTSKLKAAAADAPVGVSGSFTSADGTPKTVTVVDGLITDIS